MTEREKRIITAALDALHDQDGRQVTDVELHADVKLRVNPPPMLDEFEAAMRLADGMRAVVGVTARFGKGYRWSISDEGEAIRLQLRR